MARYHIDIHGVPVKCPAQQKCRKQSADGSVAEHFDGTKEDALIWAEKQNAKEFSETIKPKPVRKSRFSAPSKEKQEEMERAKEAREKAMAQQEEERKQRKSKPLPKIPKPVTQNVPDFSQYHPDRHSVVNEKLETMDSMNPSVSGVFEEYDMAKYRATAPLSDNITHYSKTAGIDENTMVTVYRGVPDGVKEINNGDFVTTNKQLAMDYGNKVISIQVPARDILDDEDEPLGDEYIYRIS